VSVGSILFYFGVTTSYRQYVIPKSTTYPASVLYSEIIFRFSILLQTK